MTCPLMKWWPEREQGGRQTVTTNGQLTRWLWFNDIITATYRSGGGQIHGCRALLGVWGQPRAYLHERACALAHLHTFLCEEPSSCIYISEHIKLVYSKVLSMLGNSSNERLFHLSIIIPARACGKVASDFGFWRRFCLILRFPPPLTTDCLFVSLFTLPFKIIKHHVQT